MQNELTQLLRDCVAHERRKAKAQRKLDRELQKQIDAADWDAKIVYLNEFVRSGNWRTAAERIPAEVVNR